MQCLSTRATVAVQYATVPHQEALAYCWHTWKILYIGGVPGGSCRPGAYQEDPAYRGHTRKILRMQWARVMAPLLRSLGSPVTSLSPSLSAISSRGHVTLVPAKGFSPRGVPGASDPGSPPGSGSWGCAVSSGAGACACAWDFSAAVVRVLFVVPTSSSSTSAPLTSMSAPTAAHSFTALHTKPQSAQ